MPTKTKPSRTHRGEKKLPKATDAAAIGVYAFGELLQITIETPFGGHRLCGPKFIGQSRELKRHTLTEDNAKTILRYIFKAFPKLKPKNTSRRLASLLNNPKFLEFVGRSEEERVEVASLALYLSGSPYHTEKMWKSCAAFRTSHNNSHMRNAIAVLRAAGLIAAGDEGKEGKT